MKLAERRKGNALLRARTTNPTTPTVTVANIFLKGVWTICKCSRGSIVLPPRKGIVRDRAFEKGSSSGLDEEIADRRSRLPFVRIFQ
jgi:hypothetical protein